ncbi:diguanylate cyclase/phosphodiesterase [Mycobacterium rhizamassiliense]|uniref:Diguanylate cyclase/phosphodiesterase n=1 Tax=Mycobacterium rhizamassiliense TaxID=1841860 RepID=A0A2U3NX62_9MYCO|nr:bifunctional diguanylate cyclase/phosphodiesterase [Mycobacterium rhizamassiliense]SPM36072.1 diguanylate cyclase/phosphodiesterase [Mycobacterium rhizamassiliense]
MLSLTPKRFAVVVLATVGLLVYGGLLLTASAASERALTGAVGLWISSVFANGCAVVAARAARGRQRLAWTIFSIGLAGWTAGQAVWWYVSAGGIPPMANISAANVGYVVLPLCALATAVAIPSREDTRFGVGLLLDGILVAASLFVVLAILVASHFGQPTRIVSLPRMTLAVATAVYLGLVVMSVITLRKADAGPRLSTTLMTLAWTVIAVAGFIRICNDHPEQVPTNLVILGWACGMYFMSLSAITSRPGPNLDLGFSQPSRLSTWLPYVPVLLAIVVATVHFWPEDRGEAFIFGVWVLLFLTTLTRHLLLLNRKGSLLTAVADAALRDPLTRLANQRLFDDRLAHAVRLHVHHAIPVSVLTVSVDDFKLVNDSLGYAVGDELLRSVAARIQANIRANHTVARMSGDEFAILVEDRPNVALQVAEGLALSFNEPLTIKDHRIDIRLSIGVTSAVSGLGAPLLPGDLLKQADAARHCAQLASSTNVRTFTPDMDAQLEDDPAHDDAIARLQLLGELRRAIDDGLLTLLYQPKFTMLTGSVCGVEALVRWRHPRFGVLEPAEFLPLVRDHGLMDALTDLVLSRAVADASEWYAAGAVVPVAINLWAPSVDEDTLPDRILSVLDAHAMAPNSLTIEITEDLLVADLSKARTVLNRLREAGIRVAIDDFGSGYATLTYLRELPIDDVKLDRQFIAPIVHDERAATIARSIIELARAFGISCIAEGVEDWETAQKLREFGCDAVQGNFFSRPLPASEIPDVAPSGQLMAQ